MRKRVVILSLLVFGLWAVADLGATSDAPFENEKTKVADLCEKARSPKGRSAAIEELKKIIEDEGLEASVRAHALEGMGELHLQELEGYLMEISSRPQSHGIGGVHVNTLRNAAFLGFSKSKVGRESRPKKQVALLMGMLNTPARSWAIDELCVRGDPKLLLPISKAIRSRNPFKDGEEQIALCEKKTKLFSVSPTKHAAYKAALEGADASNFFELKTWAVLELAKMKTSDANKILADYALRLQGLESEDRERRLLFVVIPELRKNGWDSKRLQSYGIDHRSVP